MKYHVRIPNGELAPADPLNRWDGQRVIDIGGRNDDYAMAFSSRLNCSTVLPRRWLDAVGAQCGHSSCRQNWIDTGDEKCHVAD